MGLIRLWDLRDRSARMFLKGHSLSIRRLVYSADGRFLTSVGQTDGHEGTEVLLWDVATGRELARIGGIECLSQVIPVFLANQSALLLATRSRPRVDESDPTTGTDRNSEL